MQIHSDVVTNTGAGGTSDTFDNVGTIRTRADAVQLYGFFVSAGPVTGTAAEAQIGQYRFTNNDLSISTIKTGPPWAGGAPATNVGYNTHLPYWIPCKRGSSGDPIGQVDLVVDHSSHTPDVAVANAVAVAAVYSARGAMGSLIPQEVLDLYRMGSPGQLPGGLIYNSDAEAVAAATTVAETAITDLVVEKSSSGIVGFGSSWAPDAFAAEELIGFIRFRSSLPNFEPQEWIMPGCGAPLGTAVGTGSSLNTQADYATFFPKEKGELTTITPNVVWVAAVTTNAPTVSADVSWMA
jgi:hypothetical protein